MTAQRPRCAAVPRRRRGAGIAAKPGYPTVIVPFGFVPERRRGTPFPAGLRRAAAAPFGVSFTGRGAAASRGSSRWPTPSRLATKRRVPPPAMPWAPVRSARAARCRA
ncbi:MAG: hypothetical protein MZW92_20375 [Comamonadaceae bacterium]|nr:hypothetical protein [Comamonadaceae bacterium]